MKYNVFEIADKQFARQLETFISESVTNISQWVLGPLTVALTLYVVLYGILILRGMVQEPVMEFAMRAIKLAIIITLVKNAADYNAYISDLFFETLPKEISEALNTAGAPSASTFDSILNKGQNSASLIWQRGNWKTMIITGIAGMMVIFIAFFVAAIGFVVSLYARVALAIVLAIGPIFVALAMFQSTRRFTEAWIGQLANFVILQVLVVALGSLLISTFDSTFTAIDGYEDVLTRPVALCAIGVVALYVFYQLPSIASALAAGGASLAYGYGAGRDVTEGRPARYVQAGGRAVGHGAKSVGRGASYLFNKVTGRG